MFETDFQEYSKKIRDKFNMSFEDEWVIEQLYMTLDDHPGGFLLEFDDKIHLGIKVIKEDIYNYNVFYKDVEYPKLRKISINSKTLRIKNDKKVKIQWFGTFRDLKTSNSLPSFTVLSKYSYELELTQNHVIQILSNKKYIGDYCAYFAWKSNVNYKNLI